MLTLILLIQLATPQAPVCVAPQTLNPWTNQCVTKKLQDDGFASSCPKLVQHYHDNDHKCHLDSDDSVVVPRKTLPTKLPWN